MTETKVQPSEVEVGDVVRRPDADPITVEAIEEHPAEWGVTYAFRHDGRWSYFDNDELLELQVEVEGTEE